jgi:hypothetical protein
MYLTCLSPEISPRRPLTARVHPLSCFTWRVGLVPNHNGGRAVWFGKMAMGDIQARHPTLFSSTVETVCTASTIH